VYTTGRAWAHKMCPRRCPVTTKLRRAANLIGGAGYLHGGKWRTDEHLQRLGAGGGRLEGDLEGAVLRQLLHCTASKAATVAKESGQGNRLLVNRLQKRPGVAMWSTHSSRTGCSCYHKTPGPCDPLHHTRCRNSPESSSARKYSLLRSKTGLGSGLGGGSAGALAASADSAVGAAFAASCGFTTVCVQTSTLSQLAEFYGTEMSGRIASHC